MDFQMVMAQVDRLDEIAERLSQASEKKLGNTLQDLSLGWKGENASAYLRKGAKLQNRINDSAGDLHNIAEDMRNRAKRMYETQQDK